MSLETPESHLQLDLLTWLEENRQLIASLFIAFSLLVVIAMVWRWRSKMVEQVANEALLAAYTPSTPPATPTPSAEELKVSSDTLLKIASDHSGTSAGERALLLAAGQLFAEGKYGPAREKFDSFLQKFPESPFAATAQMGLAATSDAMGKAAEALTGYNSLLQRFPSQSVANHARLAKAGLLESMNQPAETLAVFDEMTKAGQFSPVSQQAAMRRELLLQKHPELNKTQSVTNSVNVSAPSALAPPVDPAPVAAPAK
ncbi:MAG: tetratricopeptide repeat protein [Pedosphaera sp.]|nr:tetratricopeptide repeat protein [Pedosphaera sp.]